MEKLHVIACGVVGLLASGITPTLAGELIVPTTQERKISASVQAEFPGGQQSDSDEDHSVAPNGAPFNDSVSAYANCGPASGQGFASQTSTLSGDSIAVSGSAGMWLLGGSGTYVFAAGSSKLDITFTLAEPADYLLQGSIQAAEWGNASFSLIGPGGTVHGGFLMSFPGFPQSTSVREVGLLTPGEYRFRVSTGAADGGNSYGERSGNGAFNLVLQLAGSAGPGGVVPDGNDPGTNPLRLEKLPGGMLRLTWNPSCRADDDDYAIYEGGLNDPLASEPVTCSTSGQVTYEVTPASDASWYLVVPHDGQTEGSYGLSSAGERPPSPLACRPQQVADPICE